MSNKTVFIDRDGVINLLVDRGENCVVQGRKVRYTAPWKLSEFTLVEGIPSALEKMRGVGFLCILVTNQPDLAYGTLPRTEHEKIMQKIDELRFDDVFVCPHGRADSCDCKKPKPGLLLQAQAKWDIDLSSSFMLGDTESDMEAGRAAGCTAILVRSVATSPDTHADITVSSLAEAAGAITGTIH